jgi:hypothetical protein
MKAINNNSESLSVEAARLPFKALSCNLGIPAHIRDMINKVEDLVVLLVDNLEKVRLSQVTRIDELETLRFKYEERIDELQARVVDLEESL